ncbi:serine/threonine-protein phosphatase 5 [Tanacetum coccineum]
MSCSFIPSKKQSGAYQGIMELHSIHGAITCLSNKVSGCIPRVAGVTLSTELFMEKSIISYKSNKKQLISQHIMPSMATVESKNIQLAGSIKQQANEAFKGNKFNQAIDLYTKAIELNGQNAVYWANRAFSHTKLEEYGSAIQDASKVVEIDPKYSKKLCREALRMLQGTHFGGQTFRHSWGHSPAIKQSKASRMVDTMTMDKDMNFTNMLKLLETLICTMKTTQRSWPPTRGDSKGNGRWDGVKKTDENRVLDLNVIEVNI